jgi:hypothetical protein
MGRYSCFFCPTKDYAEKSLDEKCPSCGRTYGFPLASKPERIRSFSLSKVLGRGFYGAAYVAEGGRFGRKHVVKISPLAFYGFFDKKPGDEEAELHARLAANADHVVKIEDGFEETVIFSDEEGTQLPCYVTVLEYVDGDLLKDYLSGESQASASVICQIAIDLLRIRSQFEANRLNHNDLHAENLIVEKLRPEARRLNAICDSIKVKAIDLGSISDESKSGGERYGDLHFIATHVDALLNRLLKDPLLLEDRDYRIALALQGVVDGLASNASNLRLPSTDDFEEQITAAYNMASHPWRPWLQPLSLKGFGDHYNAQTMGSWHVPRLLVDPDERWLAEITKPGPQIITGMRGCGKTMLLRALDIQARATPNENETIAEVANRIRKDRFVGLFVSAQRLLDLKQQSLYKLENRLSRLFVNYGLQAVRALIRIHDLAPSTLAVGAHAGLASAVADFLIGGEDLRQSVSLDDLERRLTNILVLTTRDWDKYSVRETPGVVFPLLAERLRESSEILRSSTVFFLLDDVSTRYLDLDRIDELLSVLLFQDPACAFKFTSEWQTIELGLKSPGREHPIREGRDLTVFDLGADVYRTANAEGKNFISEILQKRARVHGGHPRGRTPKELLGDVPLEQIAREIATARDTSGAKKKVYRGLASLAKVCVGDIGDVIKLYEDIIRRAQSESSVPIPAKIQSECFIELGSLRLYDLNRRKGYFKDHALAFAEAAHELLVRSHRQGDGKRLRQYSSIYVRVTTDDETTKKQQIDRLRELIDASVFVFTGGAPRTKTKDSNPTQQFILNFRKIYGLSAYIGLADRDRFELTDADLAEWLDNPSKAKEILLRNQIEREVEEGLENGAMENASEKCTAEVPKPSEASAPVQVGLFDALPAASPLPATGRVEGRRIDVDVTKLDRGELAQVKIDTVFTGLGFEDRTLASNEFLAKAIHPALVYAIRYSLEGHAQKILNAWRESGVTIEGLQSVEASVSLPPFPGLVLIDVSGLSKPFIFTAIRRELAAKGRILLCHAAAEKYYPLQEDLARLFAAEKAQDHVKLLESLAEVLKGETGPYTLTGLVEEYTDPSRSRALLAFASAKHERLFALLDQREFDYIEVIAPGGTSSRSKVASLAADVACRSRQNSKVSEVGTDDLVGLVKYLDEQYLDVYGVGGANLEIGLTGSKIQAVAAAILSARRKIAQAWYLQPREFDAKRFSTGAGEIRIFDVKLADAGLKELPT